MFEFLLKFHWKFVTKGRINNIPALVQIMAWHRSGDKPLSEPMMVSLPTHICVTQPQWVKDIKILQLDGIPSARILYTCANHALWNHTNKAGFIPLKLSLQYKSVVSVSETTIVVSVCIKYQDKYLKYFPPLNIKQHISSENYIPSCQLFWKVVLLSNLDLILNQIFSDA